MKYIILLIIFFTATIFNGCCTGCDHKYYNFTCNLASNIVKYDDKLYFRYYENNKDQYINKTDTSLLYEFNDNNKTWIQIASKNEDNLSILNDYNISRIQKLYKPFDILEKDIIAINTTQYIVFNKNQATIKDIDTNNTVENITLPTANEVVEELSLSIVNGVNKVEYMPFIEKQYEWNKKRYIMFIATNKNGNKYTGYFVSIFNDTTWENELLDTQYNYYIDKYSIIIAGHTYISFDSKANIQYSAEKYITLDDNQMSIKKLFGEIYNEKFENAIDTIYDFGGMEIYNGNYGTYTFDEKGNMHLFYNKKEDIINENYDYFWYAYFEKENPTVPLYEQKIPWK